MGDDVNDFTEGPWDVMPHLDGYPAGRLIDIRQRDTGKQVACTYNQTRPEMQVRPFAASEANARLIAAAPDLLKACEMALHRFPPSEMCPDADCDGCEQERSLVLALDAAVNKAYGNEVPA